MKISYEWEWAEVYDDDILELDYQDAGHLDAQHAGGLALYSLVKNYGNEAQGIKDRAWAYIKNMALPSTFEDGTKVPDKLRAEFARVMG
jgi:hypothetical protein